MMQTPAHNTLGFLCWHEVGLLEGKLLSHDFKELRRRIASVCGGAWLLRGY